MIPSGAASVADIRDRRRQDRWRSDTISPAGRASFCHLRGDRQKQSRRRCDKLQKFGSMEYTTVVGPRSDPDALQFCAYTA